MLRLITFGISVAFAMQGAGQWTSVGGGFTWGPPRAMLWIPDSNCLVVTGHMGNTSTDSLPLRGTAYWRDSNWHAMAGGLDAIGDAPISPGLSFLRYGGELFLSGWFLQVDSVPNTWKVAKWNGVSWLSAGLDSVPDYGGAAVLYLVDDELHMMGGSMVILNGDSCSNWLVYDGTDWRCGDPTEDFYFQTSCVVRYQGDLYVGGNFSTQGGLNDLVRRTPNGYEELGPGLLGDPWVNDMLVYDSLLWVIGEFYSGAGNAASGLMAWDGTQWLNPFPDIAFTGMGRDVNLINGKLFFTGPFAVNGLPGTYYIGCYDGQSLCVLGGNDIWVDRVEGSPDTLYAATGITQDWQPGSQVVNFIMKWPLDAPADTCFSIHVGLNELALSAPMVQVFPNPTRGRFTLQWSTSVSHPRITACDAQGRALLLNTERINGHAFECTLADPHPGLIHLRWSDERRSGGITVVVEP